MYAASLGYTHQQLTPERALEWISYLFLREPPVGSKLAVATINSYKSAMHSRWCIELMPGDNPWESLGVIRALKGVKNLRRSDEVARKVLHPPSIALTPELIARIVPLVDPYSQHDMMRFAAITLATAAMLRPGEVFGSEGSRRPLHVSDITFYATSSPGSATSLLPIGSTVSDHPPPDHYTISLGATKADQFATNAPSMVSNRTAVLALWVWMHMRRGISTLSPVLFILKGIPLSTALITNHLKCLLTSIGIVNPHVTGKTFRRGGASHLVAHGVPIEDITAMGRWKTHEMVNRYSDAASKAQRIVQAGRGLGPLPDHSCTSAASASSTPSLRQG